jgi:tRNA pseudouridine-54 N-methylase
VIHVDKRHFVVVFDTFPIDRHSVKTGSNSPEVITACRCINIGLFLSNSLRRDTSVSIIVTEDTYTRGIVFRGDTLKRVSPDERSISFFLLKASHTIDSFTQTTTKTLDSGIVASRTDLSTLVDSWMIHNVYVAKMGASTTQTISIDARGGVFIYGYHRDSVFQETVLKSSYCLPRPPTPERFILDINMTLDRFN